MGLTDDILRQGFRSPAKPQGPQESSADSLLRTVSGDAVGHQLDNEPPIGTPSLARFERGQIVHIDNLASIPFPAQQKVLLYDANGVALVLTGAGAVKIDGSGATQPVSGTVTSKIQDSAGNALNSNGTGALKIDGSLVVQPNSPPLPVNTVTGDAPTLTTTTPFTGLKQTSPAGMRGFYAFIKYGTVTGTSPTLVITPQFSPDGGTTWIAFGASSALNVVGGGGQELAVSPYAITAANSIQAFGGGLPLNWRIMIVAGGTSFSIQITSIMVAYFT